MGEISFIFQRQHETTNCIAPLNHDRDFESIRQVSSLTFQINANVLSLFGSNNQFWTFVGVAQAVLVRLYKDFRMSSLQPHPHKKGRLISFNCRLRSCSGAARLQNDVLMSA